jgi:HK97 gp10 family phage protein
MPTAGIKMDLRGSKKMIAGFNKLSEAVGWKVAGKAANKALTPMVTAAKKNLQAGQDTGTLRKSIGKVKRVYKTSGVVAVIVGVKSGEKYWAFSTRDGRLHKPRKYAHLVEYGTSHSAAKPFMRPAFNSTKRKSQSIYVRQMKKGIREEVRKIRFPK